MVAGAVIYVVNGRKVWFFGVFGDEWDFLRPALVDDRDKLQPGTLPPTKKPGATSTNREPRPERGRHVRRATP